MMFDIGTLYDDFLSKINSMSREELFESARLAEESSRYAISSIMVILMRNGQALVIRRFRVFLLQMEACSTSVRTN